MCWIRLLRMYITIKTNQPYTAGFLHSQGQELGKRAMLISAAGHHHCIMIGPPGGGGKTMMAERLPTILPPYDLE